MLWPLDDFRSWAKEALTIVREVRKTYSEHGDLVWRAMAASAFDEHGLTAKAIAQRLRANPAATILAN
jgi:hypothetical protein